MVATEAPKEVDTATLEVQWTIGRISRCGITAIFYSPGPRSLAPPSTWISRVSTMDRGLPGIDVSYKDPNFPLPGMMTSRLATWKYLRADPRCFDGTILDAGTTTRLAAD